MRYVLSKRKFTVDEQWDNAPETKKILTDKQKPAIIVFNHPHDLEGIMVRSVLPEKTEFSSISMSGMERTFGEEFRKHIITVYHKQPGETLEQKQVRQIKNEKAIRKAAEQMHSGNNILIAPDGGDGNNFWKKGAVTLFENAFELPDAYLVMTYAPDSRKGDIIRFLCKKQTARTVRISKPIPIRDLPIPQEVKDMPLQEKQKLLTLGNILQNYYRSWANSTHNL